MKAFRLRLAILSISFLSLSVGALSQAPVLASMSPTALAPGMQMTLTGSGFGSTADGLGYVALPYWGSVSIVSWSDTQIVFTVPPQFVPGNLYVSQNGLNSNSLSYTVVPPVLTSMSPTALAPGMQVTLTGSGFGVAAGVQGSVGLPYWGNASIVSWSDTQIVFTVPPQLVPGHLSVTQNGVDSNSLSYTVVPPVLTSMSPTALAPGMQVTLTGSGFGAAAGGQGSRTQNASHVVGAVCCSGPAVGWDPIRLPPI